MNVEWTESLMDTEKELDCTAECMKRREVAALLMPYIKRHWGTERRRSQRLCKKWTCESAEAGLDLIRGE